MLQGRKTPQATTRGRSERGKESVVSLRFLIRGLSNVLLNRLRRARLWRSSDRATSQKRVPPCVTLRSEPPLAVFVSHDANTGGAPAILLAIAEWFCRHTNYRIKIVLIRGGRWASRFKNIAPTYIVGTRVPKGEAFRRVRDDLAAFLGERPAFVFLNSIASGFFLKLNPFPAPSICFIHEIGKTLSLFPEQMKCVIEEASLFLCDGPGVSFLLKSEYGIAPERLVEERAFISTRDCPQEMIADLRKTLRAQFGWSSSTKVVMGCGVLHWRKAPDIFVRLAARSAELDRTDAQFVWVGEGPDFDRSKKLMEDLGVADRVTFLGHREDFAHLVAAADVFALTSIEDPFPLVCLTASAAGVPSVVFREAGGIHAFVEPPNAPPAGIAVPLCDEEAFFRAIQRLLDDDAERSAMGHVARLRVAAEYDTNVVCPRILSVVRKAAGLRPRVSVIVPNYNCEQFLGPRLKSISNQTFTDYEILLIDDCSTDDSRRILSDFARNNPFTRLLFLEKNSGSPFAAWKHGIEAAEGELLWIAEADDWCESDFLDRVVRAFEVRGTRLVYGRSVPVRVDGAVAGDYSRYLNRVAPGHWDASYSITAQSEINLALGRRNTIPNASAVVVTRKAATKAIGAVQGFHLAGDWAFYVQAAFGGRVGYVHEAVNYHRRHHSTVTARIEGQSLYFKELASVGALVRALYGTERGRDRAFADFIEDDARRFDYSGKIFPGTVPSAWSPPPPSILYGVGDLAPGGAQMFGIRFANAWAALGGNVTFFQTGFRQPSAEMLSLLDPSIPLLGPADLANDIATIMDEYGAQIIISGHWWADAWVGRQLESSRIKYPWLIIMHGCYENVLDNASKHPDRAEVFSRAEKYCSCWVATAPKNRRAITEAGIRPRKFVEIINGFEPKVPRPVDRTSLGIPAGALLFTLASRAIPEKEWTIAIDALRRVREVPNPRVDAHLLLIGDGSLRDRLAAKRLPPRVHVLPFTSRLEDYIAISDVGLLPSWFAGESMPLVVIEFLAQGKPVILSDIGSCRWMISTEADIGPGGVVVPRNGINGAVTVEDLCSAMEYFVSDPSRLAEKSAAARVAYRKFRMDRMMKEYESLIRELLADASRHMATA